MRLTDVQLMRAHLRGEKRRALEARRGETLLMASGQDMQAGIRRRPFTFTDIMDVNAARNAQRNKPRSLSAARVRFG